MGKIIKEISLGNGLKCNEMQTTPPNRYTEATLIKELEAKNIGRPSTYATIISTLLDSKRNYCSLQDKKMKPSDLAIKLIDFLDSNFKELVESSYTANLEKSLDKISNGELKSFDFLNEFYRNLDEEISRVIGISSNTPQTKICPECGGTLTIKRSRYGAFYGCSNYPKCNHVEKLR